MRISNKHLRIKIKLGTAQCLSLSLITVTSAASDQSFWQDDISRIRYKKISSLMSFAINLSAECRNTTSIELPGIPESITV
jgi:hypothetical protein